METTPAPLAAHTYGPDPKPSEVRTWLAEYISDRWLDTDLSLGLRIHLKKNYSATERGHISPTVCDNIYALKFESIGHNNSSLEHTHLLGV